MAHLARPASLTPVKRAIDDHPAADPGAGSHIQQMLHASAGTQVIFCERSRIAIVR